jgi:sarcosine oxidase subunit beta
MPAVVVNAAGAWAPGLAARYGDTLAITPRRSQIFVMEHTPPLARDMPHTFDSDAMVYVRIDGAGIRSGSAVKPIIPDPPPALEADWREADELQRRVAHRVPSLRASRFTRAWAGLIEVTADNNPILGWSGAVENVYTAAGFSGHGMCLAPGLAPSIAAEIVRESPEMPLDFYRAGRLAQPDALQHESLWLTTHRPTDIDEWVAARPA